MADMHRDGDTADAADTTGAANAADAAPTAPYAVGDDLLAQIERWAAQRPAALAVEFEGSQLSYRRLCDNAVATAAALSARGVGEGDRVGWLGPNLPFVIELFYACSRLGAILLPLNSRLAVPEHRWILSDAMPRLVLCDLSFRAHLASVGPPCEWLVVDAACAPQPHRADPQPADPQTHRADPQPADPQPADARSADAQSARVVGADRSDGARSADAPQSGPRAPGDRLFARATTPTCMMPEGPSAQRAAVGLRSGVGSPSHGVLLAYTSGTTGHPKGALLDQSAFTANAVNAVLAQDMTSADRVLTALPLFHVGGLNIQTLPCLFAGGSVLLHRSFDPAAMLADIERWSPTLTVLVPAMLAAVAGHPAFATTPLESLRGIMTGSSPVPVALMTPFIERGIPVGQIYGATETAPIAVLLRFEHAAAQLGSVGKAAALCEVRVVTPNGADAAPNEPGEVWVRGPNVMRSYWRNPQATDAAMRDGWFRTGDVAYADAHGWLYVVDRLSDTIISGGENIYPAELEAVLAETGLVAEAAVIGVADERWGEVPVVVAVRPQDAPVGTASSEADCTAAVLGLFDGRLARFKHPKTVIWTDALPRTALGKVKKHELAQRYPRLCAPRDETDAVGADVTGGDVTETDMAGADARPRKQR